MLESLKHNGNLYLGWDLSDSEAVDELERQMGMNPKKAERIKSDESRRLAELEAAIAELAYGGGSE